MRTSSILSYNRSHIIQLDQTWRILPCRCRRLQLSFLILKSCKRGTFIMTLSNMIPSTSTTVSITPTSLAQRFTMVTAPTRTRLWVTMVLLEILLRNTLANSLTSRMMPLNTAMTFPWFSKTQIWRRIIINRCHKIGIILKVLIKVSKPWEI